MLDFIQRPLIADKNRRDKVERIADAVAETVKGLLLAGMTLFWGYVLIVALPDLVPALDRYLLAKSQEGATFAGTLYNVRGLGLLATLIYLTSWVWGWSVRIHRRTSRHPDRDSSTENPAADLDG